MLPSICLSVRLSIPVAIWILSRTRLDFAEASSLKDVEIRELSREVASLRSADKAVNRAAAAQAALAEAEAEVMAAVGRVEVKKEDEGAAAKGEEVVANEAVEEGEYEQEERSFIEISDSEDEEEDFEDDDKDEEWLPGKRELEGGTCTFRNWDVVVPTRYFRAAPSKSTKVGGTSSTSFSFFSSRGFPLGAAKRGDFAMG